MKTLGLCLILVASLVPSAQPADGAHEAVVKVGLDRFTFENGFSIFGTQAASMRRNIDRAVGDGDGTLTQAEVDVWRRNSAGTFTADKPECFDDFEFLRIDGHGPLRISSVSVAERGLAASAASQDPFDFSSVSVFQYAATTNKHPTVALDLHDATFYDDTECFLGSPLGVPGEEPIARSDRAFVLPMENMKIARSSVSPPETQGFWDHDGLRFESQGDIPTLITFTVERTSSWGGLASFGGNSVYYAGAAGIGLVGVAFLATELGRYKLWRLLFLVPGFTRVEKDEVLEHARREELYNFIKTNAGPSFSDLRRSLELSNGTLVHHIRILETQGYVKAERDGFRTRFYVRGPKVVASTYLTRTQQQLLEVVRAHPGLTQKELSTLVGLPRQSLFYHTKQLAAQGKLEIRQDGNRRRYWLRPGSNVPQAGRIPGMT